MSRGLPRSTIRHNGFPRVSGDEPFFVSATTETLTFSPRERG